MFACGQKTFQMKRKAEFVLTKSIAHYTSQAKCGRDALSKQSGGLFVAKAGSNSKNYFTYIVIYQKILS